MTIRETFSICPVCHKRVPARQVREGGQVYLRKTCPEHGPFSTVIWRDLVDLEVWRQGAQAIQPGENENCPKNCGICREHRQGTCCVLLEVTKRCNLNCAFCFAHGGGADEDIPFFCLEEALTNLTVPGQTLVQLSGGEPTMREDIPELIRAAKKAGCAHVQLNTNGLRLADAAYVKQLAEQGLSFVFLQFDGLDDSIYQKLRGQDLLSVKQKAIENCDRCNLGVTLVPTLVPEVNTHQIGDLLRFAVRHSPAVRGVHFQPVSYFGRTPYRPNDHQRFTLDQLIRALSDQAGDLLPPDSLTPSRCDHPLCGFHGDYMVMSDQSLYPLQKQSSCCCGPTTARQNREFVAHRWQRPGKISEPNPPRDPEGWDLSTFADRVRAYGFTLSAMAFQDAYNLDLERLRQCSLHVFHNQKWVPFCAHYILEQP
jgi:uncharacterized radical SAM superfamily Fe-S cluster-containing enzyme